MWDICVSGRDRVVMRSTQVHDGSGHDQSRLPRAVKSATTLAGPKHAVAARPTPTSTSSLGARRKRTTDQAFSTDQNFENVHNKRILRPRTTNISLSEPERLLRPTKAKSKASLATVDGHARDRIPLSVISSAGAPWKQLKTKIPIFSRSNVINRLRKTGGDTTIQKSTPAVIPTPTPTLSLAPERAPPLAFPANILDEDLFDGEPKPLSEYLSFDALDDLARWDMASLPSIPSPPTSPGYYNKSPGGTVRDTGTNEPSPPPFSAPIDDDVVLETDKDFPFPFVHRNSTVVRENMGVKKTRTLARTKSSHSLQFGPGPDPFEHGLPGLPGLPHPLPLRTLCQNTTAPNPLLSSVSSSPRANAIGKSTTPASSPKRAAGSATTWRDSYGSIHLGAVDCELSLAFPETSHFEFWDADDDDVLLCPVLLCLLAKDAYPWTGKALALPDVTLFDIRVEDIPGPSSRMVVFNPADQFSTHYTNTRIQPSSIAGSPAGGAGRLSFDPFVTQGGKADARDEGQGQGVRIDLDEITVEPKWIRTYARPGVTGPSTRQVPPLFTTSSGSPDHNATSSTGVAGPRPLHRATGSVATAVGGARGWFLKFWVPVPARLFAKRETRAFRVHARVWMNGDEERALRLDGDSFTGGGAGIGATPSGMVCPASDVSGGTGTTRASQGLFPLVAEARMTISHLRSPREMDAWY